MCVTHAPTLCITSIDVSTAVPRAERTARQHAWPVRAARLASCDTLHVAWRTASHKRSWVPGHPQAPTGSTKKGGLLMCVCVCKVWGAGGGGGVHIYCHRDVLFTQQICPPPSVLCRLITLATPPRPPPPLHAKRLTLAFIRWEPCRCPMPAPSSLLLLDHLALNGKNSNRSP